MNNKVYDFGNNESVTIGVFKENDGTYLAISFCQSRQFKTEKGAWNWLKKIGVA